MGGKMVYALRDINGTNYPVGLKLKIGRDVNNQVVLQDSQSAQHHATIWEQQGNLFIQDGSGNNTTFVNQVPVQGTMSLRLGDLITTGSTSFTVIDLDAPPTPLSKMPLKRIGCRQWLFIGAAIFMVECLCLATGGFYLYSTDVEIKGTVNDLNQIISGSTKSSDNPPSGTDQPGPEILTLSDIWLSNNMTSSFTQHDERTVEGQTPDGTAIKKSFIFNKIQQTSPVWNSYYQAEQLKNGSFIDQFEAGIVNGVIYSGSQTCETSPDTDEGKHGLDATPRIILTKELTGHLKRVETGVTINDVITDRYELRADNLQLSDSVIEIKSGNLYRARDGGYMAQIEYVVMVQPQSWPVNMTEEFSTTKPSKVTYHFDRKYSPEGTIPVKVPEVCIEKVNSAANN
jgi:hypothetical protein